MYLILIPRPCFTTIDSMLNGKPEANTKDIKHEPHRVNSSWHLEFKAT